MESEQTKERQYQPQLHLRDSRGLTRLGLTTNRVWHDDPRRLLIVLARYKFVAKMLAGKQKVMEIGCGDAFGTRIVLQEVGSVNAMDFDPVFVLDVNERQEEPWRFECDIHDMVSSPFPGSFDAAYSLDVIEHIPVEAEKSFIANIAASLVDPGVLIVGTPSIQSQAYASEASKEGHINCKDHQGLKDLLGEHFHNVFIFSMNDEVVHTGFYPMSHYLFALGVGKKVGAQYRHPGAWPVLSADPENPNWLDDHIFAYSVDGMDYFKHNTAPRVGKHRAFPRYRPETGGGAPPHQ